MNTLAHIILIISAGLTGILSAQLLGSWKFGTDKARPGLLAASVATWIAMACLTACDKPSETTTTTASTTGEVHFAGLYEPCKVDSDCPAGSLCEHYPVGSGFYTNACAVGDACPAAPAGSTAIPACTPLLGDLVCALTCPNGEQCPAWQKCANNGSLLVCG